MVVGEVTDADPELEAPDDPDPDIADEDPEDKIVEIGTEFEPRPADDDPEEGAPELKPPSPGSPEIDGPTVVVTVGNMVVVMTVLVIMVVGPLKMIVFPLPKMSIWVAIEI